MCAVVSEPPVSGVEMEKLFNCGAQMEKKQEHVGPAKAKAKLFVNLSRGSFLPKYGKDEPLA